MEKLPTCLLQYLLSFCKPFKNIRMVCWKWAINCPVTRFVKYYNPQHLTVKKMRIIWATDSIPQTITHLICHFNLQQITLPPNLEYLVISAKTSVDFSGLKYLREIRCCNNIKLPPSVKRITCDNFIDTSYLDLDYLCSNNLNTISMCRSSLKQLRTNGGNIDISHLTNLEHLEISNYGSPFVDLRQLNKLTFLKIEIWDNDYTFPDSLQELIICHNKYYLDISYLTNLNKLKISRQINNINYPQNINVKKIKITF